MNLPAEQSIPVVECVSSVHSGPTRATWLVETYGEVDVPYCSSCHFLAKRAGAIDHEKRIPISTMVVELPGNLGLPELYTAIEAAKQSARVQGYWSDTALYDIKNLEGKVRLTFRKL